MGAIFRLSAGLLLLAAPAWSSEPLIAADARIDLIGLIQRLSAEPGAERNAASDAADARFTRWRLHPAVARYVNMRAKGFRGDAPAQYAVYLSTPPDLREVYPAPDFFAALAGGRGELDAWRAELGDFVRASDFEGWERERAPLREAELESVRRAAAGRDLAAPLVQYLGVRTWDSWTVVVSPFFPNNGGASWVLEEKPGRPAIVVVYGPRWSRPGVWRRSRPVPDRPAVFAAGAWPEAVFSTAYALYEACRPSLHLAADVCRGMEGLVNAEDCVHQTWVRGIVARLIETVYGAQDAKAYREQWPPTPYQEKVNAALRAYESDRIKNKDILSAVEPLLAPFQADGRPPQCRVSDPSRRAEAVYSRRLAYYLEGRQ